MISFVLTATTKSKREGSDDVKKSEGNSRHFKYSKKKLLHFSTEKKTQKNSCKPIGEGDKGVGV